MVLDFKTFVEVVSLAGTLLVGGMKLGSLQNQVDDLKARKDESVEVVAVRVQVDNLTLDMREVKGDIKKLLSRPPR